MTNTCRAAHKMELKDILICFRCGSDDLDYSEADVSSWVNPTGVITCCSCSEGMPFDRGVLIAMDNEHSFLEQRNEKVYSDFWKRGDELFKGQTMTHEDEVVAGWRDVVSRKSLLDAGCGTGRHLHHWVDASVKQLIMLDISESIFQCRDYAFNHFDKKTPTLFIKGSMSHLPIKNSCVEVTWSAGVLGLVEDQYSTMKELCRVTKDRFILGVLTEKTLTGKIYLWANYIKPLFNRVKNLWWLFLLARISARCVYLMLWIIYKFRISTSFSQREKLGEMLLGKHAIERIECSLYDPIIIPHITKLKDSDYVDTVTSCSFDLILHKTEVLCDYFDFVRTSR